MGNKGSSSVFELIEATNSIFHDHRGETIFFNSKSDCPQRRFFSNRELARIFMKIDTNL